MNLLQLEFLFLLFLPGFALTFHIGWRRPRGKQNFLKLTLWATLVGAGVAAVVCAGLAALFFYMMSPSVDDHFTTPLTVEQARQLDCPIPLPDSARNIQFVFASGGLQALEILVRFEAPVEVCRGHVQTVADAWSKHGQVKGAQGQPMGFGRPAHPLPLTRLDKTPLPEDHDIAGRARWFDVERIENGSSTGNDLEGDYAIQFWVDEDRGVFYCKITD